ncbi:Protein tyrosine phosphatase domain-containing protein 1-like Protein, partial [Gryllus bimaculatus]
MVTGKGFRRGEQLEQIAPGPDHSHSINIAFSFFRVTDHILAMARPSTEIIKKKNIVHQFLSAGIRSIINLQIPGEHASCGASLESSGFTYNPDIFMENNIYFYNFGWKDYGEATSSGLLDMVKVMAFALEEGKVAVHCHAGLGRTGVLIACYLVYSLRVRANDAIRFVRLKRPNAVQTR